MKTNVSAAKVGKRIRKVRGKLTQMEFAAKLGEGIWQLSVSRWERGVCLPTPLALVRIAETFGTSIDWLLTGKRPWKETTTWPRDSSSSTTTTDRTTKSA